MPPVAEKRRGPVLLIILASYFMIVVDISIVITALPEIRETLGFSATGLSWVQNAYLLAFGGLLLLGARAGDLLGRRRTFTYGLALFGIASVGVGVAQSEATLIAARALQGVGAAVLAPSTLALLSTSFPEGPERARAIGAYAATAGVASSLGLVVGGLLADWPSWRVGFLINAPIALALVLAAPRYLEETARRSGQTDATGAVTSTVGMVALVYGIVRSAEVGWTDAGTLAALATALVLLTAFVATERRAAQPIMPLRLFASRERTGAYAGRLLFIGAMTPFYFFTTQYLQGVAGYSPTAAGLAFLPTTILNFAAALAAPRLARRVGSGTVLAGALVCGIVGLAWLGRMTGDTSYLTGIVLPLMLIGVSQGAALGPLTGMAIAGVDHADAGAASGVMNVAHQIGGSLGLGVLVTVFAATDGDLAHSLGAALTGAAVLTALALVVTLAARRLHAASRGALVASEAR